MIHFVFIHGLDWPLSNPETLEIEWRSALHQGLLRANVPRYRDIPITFISYGHFWQSKVVHTPEKDLIDLHAYFNDNILQTQVKQFVEEKIRQIGGDIVLLAFDLDTLVGYELLTLRPDLPIRTFITFGSLLGSPNIYKRIQTTNGRSTFPQNLSRWVNIYHHQDFAINVQNLSSLFPSNDIRRIEDREADIQFAQIGDGVEAHSAPIYLSSATMGNVFQELLHAYAYLEGLQSSRTRGQNGAESPQIDDSDDNKDASDRENRTIRYIERTISADFPAVVEPGSENLLTYVISKHALFPHKGILNVLTSSETEELNLMVNVQTSDFTVLDPETLVTCNFQRFKLNFADDSSEIQGQFLLRACHTQRLLETTIHLRFWYEREPVGQIPIPTVITTNTIEASIKRNRIMNGSMRANLNAANASDLIIQITARSERLFEITVDRDTPGTKRFSAKPMGYFPVRGEAWQYAQFILSKFYRAQQLPAVAREKQINDLGLDLWWKLPEQFHRFYWEEMHGQNLSITICSEEPYIPWELVKPQREPGGDSAPMLGLAFSMARWKQGRYFPESLDVSKFAVIAPQYANVPLRHAKQEAVQLQGLFGAQSLPGSYKSVTELLNSKGTQIIHFSGHGKFDPSLPDNSIIMLEDAPLQPINLWSATIGRSDRPLVFLNACEIGQNGWSLTQIGGWADAFCAVGCTAFVGPYWSVNDKVAMKVALMFYQELYHRKTVGQALQEIRRHFWEDNEFRYDPTWLAYSLHCQPNVQILFQ